MIDIKYIRENPEFIKKNCEIRGSDVDVDAIVALDKERREVTQRAEFLRSERNRLSKECKTNPAARDQVKAMKDELSALEEKERELNVKVDEALSWLPNILDPEVPMGKDDADNKEIRKVGTIRDFDFPIKDHQEIAEKLDILDIKRGAKVAQAGFYYWKGKGALLCDALYTWVKAELIKRGFTPMITPCLAKERTLFGTGYLPFFADQTYKLEREDLALIGTSEQTLVGYHADETLEAEKLPLFYTAYSPCFRTEAGSYGKASRGIFRVHQFHKVEQIIFCKPEDSVNQHLFALQKLGLPYHVVDVCVGDMGAPGYRKYDIEAWFPGFNGYREVTSNTNLTEFQSRRLNIRYKAKDGSKGYVHTISATAATDRVAICILENYQQADGSVIIPEVLRPYTGFDKIEVPE